MRGRKSSNASIHVCVPKALFAVSTFALANAVNNEDLNIFSGEGGCAVIYHQEDDLQSVTRTCV